MVRRPGQTRIGADRQRGGAVAEQGIDHRGPHSAIEDVSGRAGLDANHHSEFFGCVSAQADTGANPLSPPLQPMPTTSSRAQSGRISRCLMSRADNPGVMKPVWSHSTGSRRRQGCGRCLPGTCPGLAAILMPHSRCLSSSSPWLSGRGRPLASRGGRTRCRTRSSCS